jgi:hypothetical protein
LRPGIKRLNRIIKRIANQSCNRGIKLRLFYSHKNMVIELGEPSPLALRFTASIDPTTNKGQALINCLAHPFHYQIQPFKALYEFHRFIFLKPYF